MYVADDKMQTERNSALCCLNPTLLGDIACRYVIIRRQHLSSFYVQRLMLTIKLHMCLSYARI